MTMIKFSLKCAQDHRFDSWFQSADAYDKLAGHGMISCAHCGDTQIQKSIMAPSVQARRANHPNPSIPRPETEAELPVSGALRAPSSPAEQKLAEMRRKLEKNSEYVGSDFVREARQMHEGNAPERSIHGEARIDDARKLVEDGVPIMPLPFRPARKLN